MLITDAHQIKPPGFASSKATSTLGAVGLNYERKLNKELTTFPGYDIWYQTWFTYNAGLICAPDFILVPNYTTDKPLPLLVIECKLKYNPDGTLKLTNLYLPVVRCAFKLNYDPIGIQICKHLSLDVKVKTIKSLAEAKPNSTNILQWLIHSKIT
jgi:hypothetical protein